MDDDCGDSCDNLWQLNKLKRCIYDRGHTCRDAINYGCVFLFFLGGLN